MALDDIYRGAMPVQITINNIMLSLGFFQQKFVSMYSAKYGACMLILITIFFVHLLYYTKNEALDNIDENCISL